MFLGKSWLTSGAMNFRGNQGKMKEELGIILVGGGAFKCVMGSAVTIPQGPTDAQTSIRGHETIIINSNNNY